MTEPEPGAATEAVLKDLGHVRTYTSNPQLIETARRAADLVQALNARVTEYDNAHEQQAQTIMMMQAEVANLRTALAEWEDPPDDDGGFFVVEDGSTVPSAADAPRADRPSLDDILCTISDLQSAAITLAEYARDLAKTPTAALSIFEDAPQAIAQALATTLDAMRQDPPIDEDTQLRGALARYLDGWVA